MDKIRQAWEYAFKKDAWKEGRDEISRVSNILERHDDQLGKKVLDLGSGHGRNTMPLARKGYNVTCVELTTAGLERTRKKLEEEKLTASLVQGNYHNLPFEKETFDSIICCQSFQYNTTPDKLEQAFSEAVRVLRPGGFFYLRVRSEKFRNGRHLVYDPSGDLQARGIPLDEILNLAEKYNMELLEDPVDSHADDENGDVIKEGQWNIVMRKKENKNGL